MIVGGSWNLENTCILIASGREIHPKKRARTQKSRWPPLAILVPIVMSRLNYQFLVKCYALMWRLFKKKYITKNTSFLCCVLVQEVHLSFVWFVSVCPFLEAVFWSLNFWNFVSWDKFKVCNFAQNGQKVLLYCSIFWSSPDSCVQTVKSSTKSDLRPQLLPDLSTTSDERE